MPRLPHRPLLLAICLTLPLAACSDDPAETASADDTIVTTTTAEPDRTTISTTSTAAAPDVTPEQEVEAAYLRAAEIVHEAYLTSDPDHPGLVETRTGENLENVRAQLTERRDRHEVAVFPDGEAPTQSIIAVKVLDPTAAEVTVCFVDNGALVREDTGQIINSEVVTKTYNVQLTRTDGTWKIALISLVNRVEGEAACP